MREYTLVQRYALIALDGLDSMHISVAKRAALRGAVAAQMLEPILEEGDWENFNPDTFAQKLSKVVEAARKQRKKAALTLEKEVISFLKEDGAIEEIPDLLACDLNYDTAGVEIQEYRSDADNYRRITEGMRAEFLEEGPVSQESICLLWLLREAGCIHELFSVEEQKKLYERLPGLTAQNSCYRLLWEAEFHKVLEDTVNSFLRGKHNLFKNPYLEGINLLFPFLERRQAIFIDYVIFGTDVSGRRLAMFTYLTEKGHYVEEVRYGNETLLKIDNTYYRIFPKTISCNRIPIQGVNLLPFYG